MSDASNPNQPVTITLERWRWEQVLLCLDRYVAWLRGDYSDDDALSEDAEWADELGWMTDDLRDILIAGGNIPPTTAPTQDSHPKTSPQVSDETINYQASETRVTTSKRNPPWSDDENTAVIDAYFWMLDEQHAFREFNKRAKYQELMAGGLRGRSRPSIERKMQNISAVLQRHGIDWVEGLAPLGNIQADLGVAVEAVLTERGLIDQSSTNAPSTL